MKITKKVTVDISISHDETHIMIYLMNVASTAIANGQPYFLEHLSKGEQIQVKNYLDEISESLE